MIFNALVPRRVARVRSPFAPMDFDRIFDDVWRGFGNDPDAKQVFAPRVDIQETEKDVRIVADLPGLEDKDIEVALDGDILTLKGHRADEKKEDGDEKDGWQRVERYRGSFERTFRLPFDVDADAIQAHYKQGVLTVVLTKPVETRPQIRQIPITSA